MAPFDQDNARLDAACADSFSESAGQSGQTSKTWTTVVLMLPQPSHGPCVKTIQIAQVIFSFACNEVVDAACNSCMLQNETVELDDYSAVFPKLLSCPYFSSMEERFIPNSQLWTVHALF